MPSIGVAAPVLLGLARMIQGLSLGRVRHERDLSQRIADEKHRGFYSSFQCVTLIGGQLCAILVLLLLEQVFLTNAQLKAWGWRIPFAIGALLCRCPADAAQLARDRSIRGGAGRRPSRGSIKALRRYPREVLTVVGLTMGGTTAFYTYTTYMQKFLKLSVGLSDQQTTLVPQLADLRPDPAAHPGALSDRIGRKPLLIWFGVTGTSSRFRCSWRCSPPRARSSRSSSFARRG